MRGDSDGHVQSDCERMKLLVPRDTLLRVKCYDIMYAVISKHVGTSVKKGFCN